MKFFYNSLIVLLLIFFITADLNATNPIVKTKLTEDYPLIMRTLKEYVIYIDAFVDEPDTIDEIIISINSNVYSASENNGFYYFIWTPSDYGVHNITIAANTANGYETIITKNIEVITNASTQVVETIKDVVIEFGGDNSRWYYGNYTLPQFTGGYNSVNASLKVECPNINGFCDDWDRWAHIDVKSPDGNWIQLIRYITPYGIGCNHEIELSDYISLLQGEVEFRVFIDTWGTGGWQLTLNLTYNQGTPAYDYSTVIEVWDGTYNFGDPSDFQPVETHNLNISNLVTESHLILSTTGHGWGSNNSNNAAEFFNATHYIDVNTQETFIQNLWNICNPNPDNCSNQQGTWQYNRAGWCPGAISPPDKYNLSSYIGTGVDLDYRFHPTYEDLCHPNNLDCNEFTCPDCNDGYNPHYYVDAHIINKSNVPLIYGNVLDIDYYNNDLKYEISVYPNPSNGNFTIQTDGIENGTRISILTIDGKQVKTYYFNNREELSNYIFDLSDEASGIYFINLENKKGNGVKKIIIR
tara:strand:+ start:148 stop:1722 length:1575 start_codon:yes stop_codon:yes gene_type:complete